MKKIVLLFALLISSAISAQIPQGEYRVITWQYANSEKILADGVFEPEQNAILVVSELSLNIYIGGYPSLIVLQGEWTESGSMWYTSSLNVKGESAITLFCEKEKSLDNGWMFSVYYNSNCIERFGVVKNQK